MGVNVTKTKYNAFTILILIFSFAPVFMYLIMLLFTININNFNILIVISCLSSIGLFILSIINFKKISNSISINTIVLVKMVYVGIDFYGTFCLLVFVMLIIHHNFNNVLNPIILYWIITLGIKGITVSYYLKLYFDNLISGKKLILYSIFELFCPINYIVLKLVINRIGRTSKSIFIEHYCSFLALSFLINVFFAILIIGKYF